MEVDPRRALLTCAGDPRGDIAEGAQRLAAEDCAEGEVARDLRTIDALARDLGDRLGSTRGAEAIVIIRALLRERVGLRLSWGGDPRIHYLHLVLQRGAGIPISCAVLWMAVGRRAGLSVEGIGLPGHFGIRVDGVLAEPADGEVLDEDGAVRMVAAATTAPPTFCPSVTWCASSWSTVQPPGTENVKSGCPDIAPASDGCVDGVGDGAALVVMAGGAAVVATAPREVVVPDGAGAGAVDPHAAVAAAQVRATTATRALIRSPPPCCRSSTRRRRTGSR